MFLIEIYLPTRDNHGRQFPKSAFKQVRNELTERFGGVTAFMRSPAMGLWADRSGEVRRDDIAIFEVMTDAVDRDWWREYRSTLESRFRQDEVVVRSIQIERL